MVKQKGICEVPECGKEYEYEYNPKYPRKYCPECSVQKKQEFEARSLPENQEDVPVVKPGFSNIVKEHPVQPKSNGLKPYEKDPVGLVIELMCAHTDLNIRVAIQIVKEIRKAFE